MAWNYEIRGESSADMEMSIYDQIGTEGKGITSAMVRDALKSNKNAKSLRVNIHSAGGEVLDGLAIYNLLSSHPAHVTVRIDTLAASIASVIAMAGDEIEIGKGAFLMVHCPYAQTKGGSDDLRKLADVLDKMQDSMVAIYSKRTGKSKTEICDLMEAETWMTGEEAVKNGFASKVVSSTKKAPAFASESLKIYAKVPDAILEQLTAPDNNSTEEQTMAMSKEDKEEFAKLLDEHKKDMEAKFELFKKGDKQKAESDKAAKAAAKAKAAGDDGDDGDDDEDEVDAKAETEISVKAEATIMAALAEANKMVAALSAKLEAQSSEKFEACVDAAVASGKLLPSQKAWAMTLDSNGFDKYLAAVGEAALFPVGKEHKEDKVTAELATAGELTAEEKKLAKSMGISEADVVAYNKAHAK